MQVSTLVITDTSHIAHQGGCMDDGGQTKFNTQAMQHRLQYNCVQFAVQQLLHT